jgi:protein TonB
MSMRFGVIIAVFCAVMLHVGFILFGGLLIPQAQQEAKTSKLSLGADDPVAEQKKEQPKDPEETPAKVENQEEPPPDAERIARTMEAEMEQSRAPALELASLASMGSALNGSGGGDFGEALTFASGGVVGGTGKAGALGKTAEAAFSMDEIDQKPRAIFQASPTYPAEMRGKKIEGVVSVLFVVDPAGKVVRQRVEKSNNVVFEKPALDAVKQWKFEPGSKGGQRVACKMRVSVRFPVS